MATFSSSVAIEPDRLVLSSTGSYLPVDDNTSRSVVMATFSSSVAKILSGQASRFCCKHFIMNQVRKQHSKTGHGSMKLHSKSQMSWQSTSQQSPPDANQMHAQTNKHISQPIVQKLHANKSSIQLPCTDFNCKTFIAECFSLKYSYSCYHMMKITSIIEQTCINTQPF